MIKRLFVDIETSPNVVLSWRLGYKVKLDHDNLLQERAIICACWKWQGIKKVGYAQWSSNGDDRPVLQGVIPEMNEADEIVMHNGDSFDLPWIKTRCIYHGIPTAHYKTIDTLQWARRKFLFNSNRLDYIGKYLGIGGKVKTEFNLWKSVVLERDNGALKRMVNYCKRDVELLEQVYNRLAAHMPAKTHAGVMAGNDKWSCPHCASESVKASKAQITALGAVRRQMQCKSCGRYYSISNCAYDRYNEFKRKGEELANA